MSGEACATCSSSRASLARTIETPARWRSRASALHCGRRSKALYKSTVRDRLAAALAMIATRAHYDDLLAFLADEALGATRIYFLRPGNRIGNRMRAGKGRSVIEELADDAVLGAEASALLAGRSRSA